MGIHKYEFEKIQLLPKNKNGGQKKTKTRTASEFVQNTKTELASKPKLLNSANFVKVPTPELNKVQKNIQDPQKYPIVR